MKAIEIKETKETPYGKSNVVHYAYLRNDVLSLAEILKARLVEHKSLTLEQYEAICSKIDAVFKSEER